MVRATTPTFTLTVGTNQLDLTQADAVYVTITQVNTTITKTGEDLEIDGNVISCWLEEPDSIKLINGTAQVQVNWVYTDSVTGDIKRAASDIAVIGISDNLIKGALIE